MSISNQVPSTQPYFIRALHEWCTDNGFTPYMSVKVDASVRVPMAYVQDGEIVLNTSYDATSGLQIDNEFVHFQARFGGVMHDILIPIHRIQAVFARENGQGMGFAVVDSAVVEDEAIDETSQPSSVETSIGEDGGEGKTALQPGQKEEAVPTSVSVTPQQTSAQAPQENDNRTGLTAVPETDEALHGDAPSPSPKGAGKKRPALRLVK